MQQPADHRHVSGRSLAATIDDFLEFVQNNRAADTYRWYRKYLQKFILDHKEFRVDDIRPFGGFVLLQPELLDFYASAIIDADWMDYRCAPTCVRGLGLELVA